MYIDMKRYGLWRYLLILLILGLGIVYSLPNFYIPDPAVQISYTSSSQTADEFLAERVTDIVKNEDFDAKIQLENDYVLVRTDSGTRWNVPGSHLTPIKENANA